MDKIGSMTVKCEKCSTVFNLDKSLIKNKYINKLRCSKCKHVFTISFSSSSQSWGFTLKNLTASWENKTILNNIDLDKKIILNSNNSTKLPIMGPSGQGKSTLMYMLAMLKKPESGSVIWNFPDGKEVTWGPGVSIKDFSKIRRDYFGFAFQNSTLLPHLTIRENLFFPQLRCGIGKNEAEYLSEFFLKEVLLQDERVNLKCIMASHPKKLSGGQQQRVALAQAMITQPNVLFADEPTGNLDISTRYQIMKVMGKWVNNKIFPDNKRNTQRLLVWVTHHADDPDIMRVNKLLYVDKKNCNMKNRNWWKKQKNAMIKDI
ncbi:ABC transporter domain-containing protein [Candidatus Magnetomoraceae bacterium gMMP-15]